MKGHEWNARAFAPVVHGSKRWSVVLVTTLAACALSLAGAGTAVASATPKAAPAAVTGWPVTNYVAYTGGTAGPANSKLSPVYLGWVNQQGGTDDIAPEATIGAQFSVSYINKYLGGIDGHPLKLVECFIPDTVSAAASCGDEMANNPKVEQIVIGAPLVVGNQAFESALVSTHKLLNMFDGSGEDANYRNAVWLYGSATSLEGPIATFLADDLHAKTVAIVEPNTPGTAASVNAVTTGLTLDHVKYTSVSYDPSDTDFTATLEAAGASTAGALLISAEGSECGDMYLALNQLNIKTPVVLAGPTCDTPAIAASTGGKLPRWYFAIGSTLYTDSTDPAALALQKAFGTDPSFAQQWGADTWIDTTFSQVLTAAKFMNEVGVNHLTAKNLEKTASSFRGPMLWGPPQLVCGVYSSAPQVCLDEDQFFRPNAAGIPVRAQSWVSKPKGEPING
jgi:ABC-type branched-subunit amino acid transport system substrate-binding protein